MSERPPQSTLCPYHKRYAPSCPTCQAAPTDAYEQYIDAQRREWHKSQSTTPPPPIPYPDPEQIDRLAHAALQAIHLTLADGKATYAPGEWMRHSLSEHLSHGIDHADHVRRCGGEEQRTELRHAICRLVFVLALLDAPPTP